MRNAYTPPRNSSLVGSTRFRSTIFNKHQVGDKNSKLIKSIIQQSLVKSPSQDSNEIAGPQLSLYKGMSQG